MNAFTAKINTSDYVVAFPVAQPWRSPWMNVRWVFCGPGADRRAREFCEKTCEAALLIETNQSVTPGRLPRGVKGARTWYGVGA